MLPLGCAGVRFTSRADGDLGHAGKWVAVHEVDPLVEERRRKVLDRPWSWVRQVHGSDVIVVTEPGGGAGSTGDALVTRHPEAALAVLTADCAPIALVSPEGVIGAVHAGWRGLLAGVVDRAADTMREMGASSISAGLGPCIHPECYAFGPADLEPLVDRYGADVAGQTREGEPALDLPAAVGAALDAAGVCLDLVEDVCTACSDDHFSHRARQELARQAVVVWLP